MSTNPTITTIIFDLGGVLVDWKPEYLYREIFNKDEKKVRWFLDTVCTSEWNIEQDGGRTIEEAVNTKVAEFPQYETWIRMFYTHWEQMFSGPIRENVSLMKNLQASGKYRVYALTNWSAEKWDKALELFPFFKNFEGVVVSGQEKCRKPFPEIYHILLDRYHIEADTAVFIDDNLDNIMAAKEIGIHGIHCQDPTQLASDLYSLLNNSPDENLSQPTM